jgi:hypothetical protein
MINLAIQGHATRGKEVIKTLEMLGGVNSNDAFGDLPNNWNVGYYIFDGVISVNEVEILAKKEFKIYTLEEFLEKFPYKVGDKVKIAETGKIVSIEDMSWKNESCEVVYETCYDNDCVAFYSAIELQPYKEETMENVKKSLEEIKEKSKARQIEFLRTYYNGAIVDAAVEYANSEIDRRPSGDTAFLEIAKRKAIEAGYDDVIDYIDLFLDHDNLGLFDTLTFAYAHGMSFGLENPNISATPEPVTDYVLKKDFAFIFDFGDNDFGTYIECAAKEFCKEYNNLLSQIELYSSISDGGDLMADSYKRDLESMENPDNIRQLMKAAFIGEYMTRSIDRWWLGRNAFDATECLEKAQDLANNYFNFETNTTHYDVDNTDRVDWKFGTWDEISKFGLEEYKNQQGDEELKYANGDFTKYWLNGEVLIVRMIKGKLVATVR